VTCPDVKHIIFIRAIKAFYPAGTPVAPRATGLENVLFNGSLFFDFGKVEGEGEGKAFRIGSGPIQLEMMQFLLFILQEFLQFQSRDT
jgi:hypothetical protein